MRSRPSGDARALAALYDEGYYHGVNSGYPPAGYESEHATWTHWVAHLADVYGTGARWLDLGCAYGYLVAEAAAGGFHAVGVDVSVYGLGRARTLTGAAAGRLARGVVEELPFPDATFDVVSAFDVLEHVLDPEAVLREAARVLRPGGALIGATPDPCVFDRSEATHFSERPPSFWIDRLLALGFAVDFRFFQAPYNLELLAERGAGPMLRAARRLRPDGFGSRDDLGAVAGGAGRVGLRLRAGFSPASAEHGPDVRWVERGEACAYVVVTGRAPVRLAVTLEVRAPTGAAETTLTVDDYELTRATLDRDWRLLETPAIPVAAGGHHLRLRTSAPLFVRRLVVAADHVEAAELVARLPFDMYQRYDQCRAVATRLPAPRPRVLDVGGVLGGAGGHLASTADFFPFAAACTSVDVRASDHPDHRTARDGRLPFPDASFDLVLSLDVLEHVPQAARHAWLDELARVARRFVLLGAPFATAGVAGADTMLFELIRARHGYEHGFLAEHLTHGHPDLAGVVAYWEARGASVMVLPNGYLPYWMVMQLLNLRLAEPAMGERYARAQARYNGSVCDWRAPAYRHLLVVDLAGATDWCPAMRALAVDAAAPGAGVDAASAAALSAIVDLATPGGAASVPPSAGPPARSSEPDEASRPRAPSARRDFAAGVHSHAAYRVYARLRQVWRRWYGDHAA